MERDTSGLRYLFDVRAVRCAGWQRDPTFLRWAVVATVGQRSGYERARCLIREVSSWTWS